jgi:hypothetical protein
VIQTIEGRTITVDTLKKRGVETVNLAIVVDSRRVIVMEPSTAPALAADIMSVYEGKASAGWLPACGKSTDDRDVAVFMLGPGRISLCIGPWERARRVAHLEGENLRLLAAALGSNASSATLLVGRTRTRAVRDVLADSSTDPDIDPDVTWIHPPSCGHDGCEPWTCFVANPGIERVATAFNGGVVPEPHIVEDVDLAPGHHVRYLLSRCSECGR